MAKDKENSKSMDSMRADAAKAAAEASKGNEARSKEAIETDAKNAAEIETRDEGTNKGTANPQPEFDEIKRTDSKLSHKDVVERLKSTATPASKREAMKSEASEQEQFVTGFHFDFYRLTELYANLRDGNYWSAFRLVVALLNENINPGPRPIGRNRSAIVGNAPGQTPVTVQQLDEIIENLESCCDGLHTEHERTMKATGEKKPVRASSEKNVGAVDFNVVLLLVKALVDLLKNWRQANS